MPFIVSVGDGRVTSPSGGPLDVLIQTRVLSSSVQVFKGAEVWKGGGVNSLFEHQVFFLFFKNQYSGLQLETKPKIFEGMV